jgi:hypothetical protein
VKDAVEPAWPADQGLPEASIGTDSGPAAFERFANALGLRPTFPRGTGNLRERRPQCWTRFIVDVVASSDVSPTPDSKYLPPGMLAGELSDRGPGRTF